MDNIEKRLAPYYNKFNEDKRLTRPHGIVEKLVSFHYINKYLEEGNNIIDIGAGTGAYSIPLLERGFNVTALELCNSNISCIKKKCPSLNIIKGNALNLKKISDDSYDITIMFGPMYHLHKEDEKVKCLQEALRITKPRGIIFVAYILNNYAILRHGFMDHTIMDNLDKIDDDFNIIDNNDIYSYINIECINKINKKLNVNLLERFSQKGPSDYIRSYINKMDEPTFNKYIEYVIKTSSSPYMIGAGSHVVDIIKV